MIDKATARVRTAIDNHKSSIKWAIIALLCLASMLYALNSMGYTDYVQSWIGTAFKAVSGGCIGWIISRHVLGLDISELPVEHRPMAGLSLAVLIAGFAVAIALGL